VGHLSQIDRLFTDATPPAAFGQLLTDANVQLHIAD
jgi:DeoR family glycerol-3-phosphate regulon repressor